jgi:hypothetical protein
VPNAVRTLSHGKQLILRAFSKEQAIVRAGKCRTAVGRPPVRPNIDTRDDSITGFHRLTAAVPLLDSVAYAFKPFVWSEFDLWHGVCTCLL